MRSTLLTLFSIFLLFNVFSWKRTSIAQETRIPLTKTLTGHFGGVNSISFSPDSKFLASGGNDDAVILWEVRSGKLLKKFIGHSDNILTISYSPDGKFIASGSADHSIKIWETTSGSEVHTFKGHSYSVNCLAFSPDGRILASGSSDNLIKIWDYEKGRELKMIHSHRFSILDIKFSVNGKTFGSRSVDGSIKLWDAFSWQELLLFSGPFGEEFKIFFGKDSNILISSGKDLTIKLWNTNNGNVLSSIKGNNEQLIPLAISPEGDILVTATKDKNLLRFWDILTQSQIQGLELEKTNNYGSVTELAYSPDGEILAGASGRFIFLWSNRLLKLLAQQQQANEIKLISHLFKSKDEFETEAEYQSRINKAKAEKKAINERYTLLIAQEKQRIKEHKLLREREKEREIQTKIRESLSETTLSISYLGTYNADAETFPITINGITKKIRIPRPEARSFKANWRNAEVRAMKQLKKNLWDHEYFNIVIIHPVTGNQYPFGDQRDLGQIASRILTTSSAAKKAVTPPKLSLTAKLSEPSANGFLDAEEKGKILVKITNTGEGAAFGVILDVKNEGTNPNITFSRTRVAGEIRAGRSKTVEFAIEAGKQVKRALQNFVIMATESNGFDPDPVKLSFETYPLLLPELSLVDYGISTASGDNIISPGEVVNLKARVQNIGEGKAKNVSFTVNLPANVFFAPQSKKSFHVAELSSGAFEDLEFAILTNQRVEKQVDLVIGMTEENTQKSFPLALEIEKPLRTLQEFVVKGKEREKTIVENVAMLSVDIARDIPRTTAQNPTAYAVVIGNRDYLKVKNVDFAINDATLVKEYLIKTLGYRDENIFFIKNATKADFELYFGSKGNFKGKLYNAVRPDAHSDVFVFYSGHGSPDLNDKKGYFVPVDADPQYVGIAGYSLDVLYENLAQVPAKSISVVLDACFSGAGLFDNISPVRIKFTNALMGMDNAVVLSSSTGDQVSSWYPEKRHGMFTYFFLKAIHNKNADYNNDGMLTFDEIFNFVGDPNEGVPRYARKLHNVEQNPAMMGDRAKVLVTY